MTDLNSAIRQLRADLEATLVNDASARIELREASVTLGLVLESGIDAAAGADALQPVRWGVVPPGTQAQHTLTLTLVTKSRAPVNRAALNGHSGTASAATLHVDPDNPQGSAAAAALNGIPPAPVSGNDLEEEAMAAQCVRVFGEPGFDNAARAEVFCEISQGFEPGELLRAIQLAESDQKVPADDPHARAVTRLRQVLKFSPEGPQEAAQILLSILREGHKAALQTLLARRWRFGTHWELPGNM